MMILSIGRGGCSLWSIVLITTQAVYLGPTGKSGAFTQATEVVRDALAELGNEHWPLGPGADNAHVPDKDVDELGPFV